MHMGTTAGLRGLGRNAYSLAIASGWPYDRHCQVKFDGSFYALLYLVRVVQAMECLMRGRITFMVAHRLGTLANCERS
jgi:hypothetical protein